jgi:hypothetical protein
MRAVMGVSNVQMLNAHVLESSFTDWLVGQCLTCIEEVRLINAHNKYEVLNKVKPNITNHIIEVHPKGKAPYNAVNTTSYLFFSNFRDALPLDDDGRRYCILFSQWQRKDKLDAFKRENPDYYEDLYSTIETSAPALRKWLLEWEQDESFKPYGDAPATDAKRYMIRQAQPQFIQDLYDLIAEKVDPLISFELLDGTRMIDTLMERGLEVPGNKAVGSMLSRHRFESLGKIRVGGEVRTYYTRDLDMFQSVDADGCVNVDNSKVRKYVEAAKASMPDDDDEL